MDRRINITYHSTDELMDMLREAVECLQPTREEIIRALEALTGEMYDDDGTGDLLEME